MLLNTTSKQTAALAACLTLLSYIATAVISAHEAMHYAHTLWSALPVMAATIALLGLFAFLNIVGITESAVVATGIFLFHLLTLATLVVACSLTTLSDLSILAANWQAPSARGLAGALFYGFAAAMLGISGFESSANFIEEQKPGVFAKTLRNMWLAVGFFNPVISFLSLCLLPLASIQANKNTLLAEMGARSALPWLAQVVSIDAVLVLSGAVLTSYVGVTGLVRRMSLDRCLPQVLLHENSWRRTNHWIIGSFFVLCCSILLTTGGNTQVLAGVYTISFLGVMALFALGNMLLKIKRSRLPREERAGWPAVIFGFFAVMAGLLGNILMSPEYVQIFAIYFILTVLAVAAMFLRVSLLKGVLLLTKSPDPAGGVRSWLSRNTRDKMKEITREPVLYFTRGDHLANLNRAALYVLDNEQTNNMLVVHVHRSTDELAAHLADHLAIIDRLYPELRIDFITVEGKFGPELIERLSSRLRVPKNYMFIGTPSDRFPHNIAELGGVRLII